jgi:hypothetical protein
VPHVMQNRAWGGFWVAQLAQATPVTDPG